MKRYKPISWALKIKRRQMMNQIWRGMNANTAATSAYFSAGNIIGSQTATTATTTMIAPTQLMWTSWANAETFDDRPPSDVLTIQDRTTLRTINFPDGTVINVAPDASFTINDANAKVTYRANRVREFNSFVNASDKMEGFIAFCGGLGVKQEEMLALPVKLFIMWLVIEAANADGDDADYEPLVEELRPLIAQVEADR